MTVSLAPYTKDDHDWLVAAHGTQYALAEGFDETFGPLVDSILTDFDAAHDPARERGWIAWEDGQRLGSIFCVDAGGGTAKLRLFLLMPEARGKGLGHKMLNTCMGFARDVGYTRMTLWTHESHKAACALYLKTGFALRDQRPVTSFGLNLVEQHWDIAL